MHGSHLKQSQGPGDAGSSIPTYSDLGLQKALAHFDGRIVYRLNHEKDNIQHTTSSETISLSQSCKVASLPFAGVVSLWGHQLERTSTDDPTISSFQQRNSQPLHYFKNHAGQTQSTCNEGVLLYAVCSFGDMQPSAFICSYS